MKTRLVATVSLKVAKVISDTHTDFCAKAAKIEDGEDLLDFKKRAPVEATLCSENAQIVANYATSLVTLPGLISLAVYRRSMSWWGVEDYEEQNNELMNTVLETVML